MREKLTELQTALIDRLLDDLGDEDKANPNLYKVIREFLRDHAGEADALPKSALDEIGRKAPFKLHSETG